jgi:hypothetical protein
LFPEVCVVAAKDLTLDEVVWAYSVAQSRGFNVFVEGAENTDFALIPLVDMMNHDSASVSDIRMSVEENEVVVTAHGGFNKGDAFDGRYQKANKTSASWLASYGFLNSKSLYQGLKIDYEKLQQAAQFEPSHHAAKIQKVLHDVGCRESTWRDQPFALTVDGFRPGYMLCMRLALLSPEDYKGMVNQEIKMHMSGASHHSLLFSPYLLCSHLSVFDLFIEDMITPANEQKMIGTVNRLLRQLLSGYGTTLEEDAKILQTLKVSLGHMLPPITCR